MPKPNMPAQPLPADTKRDKDGLLEDERLFRETDDEGDVKPVCAAALLELQNGEHFRCADIIERYYLDLGAEAFVVSTKSMRISDSYIQGPRCVVFCVT